MRATQEHDSFPWFVVFVFINSVVAMFLAHGFDLVPMDWQLVCGGMFIILSLSLWQAKS